MHTQPESRVLIDLRLTSLRVISDLCRKQLAIALNLGRRCVGIDDRLHDSACSEYRGWSKGQNVSCGATLGFVSIRDSRAAGFELLDVMFENRLGNRNQSGDVIVSRARARLNVREM